MYQYGPDVTGLWFSDMPHETAYLPLAMMLHETSAYPRAEIMMPQV
ncbi:hypothetical protein MUP79_08580 [Candidatus Bathyarchaeota archaeon]|nr:hypothetical protein [Candidatus Bathyarchaeota archaeon]